MELLQERLRQLIAIELRLMTLKDSVIAPVWFFEITAIFVLQLLKMRIIGYSNSLTLKFYSAFGNISKYAFACKK